MILNINGNLNRYYAQTLCLIFFPGAKFSQSEKPLPETPCVDISVSDAENGAYGEVTIKIGDRVASASKFTEHSSLIPRERTPKIAAGEAMLEAGKKFFGYVPSWGILTGVRPSKVASELLDTGIGIFGARRTLRDEYFLNPKKAELAVTVAAAEKKLTKKYNDGFCSLYISIPFCPSRCTYCSFVSASSKRLLSLTDDYLKELLLDIAVCAKTIKAVGKTLATIYIGGGTPTVLTAAQLKKLLTAIEKNFDVNALAEFTLEAGRPDTITPEKLKVAKEHGVTRISVNPQSLCDDVLEGIGRRHTADDFFRAYDVAANSGIAHINTDLIAGLPRDNFARFSDSLDRIIALAPDNVTVHAFCLKRASDMACAGVGIDINEADATRCVDYSQMRLRGCMYKPYYMYRQKNSVGNLENVGYAKDDSAGLYNIFMMEELHSIFALGAGSVTKLLEYGGKPGDSRRIERIFAPKYPYEYLRDAEKIRNGADGVPGMRERAEKFFAE